MGCCLSKKKDSSLSPFPPIKNKLSATAAGPADPESISNNKDQEQHQQQEDQKQAKKETFGIQHRKSTDHDSKCPSDDGNTRAETSNGGPVRASSCTKDEVEAILIRCGRLSRSSSAKGAVSANASRRYSGSKRSHDFDDENVDGSDDGKKKLGGDLAADEDRTRRRRESRGPQGRRTPSRSRERGRSSGRRVSRSPGRRSESPVSKVSNGRSGSAANNGSRPGRMVSLPATVSSLSNDKAEGGRGSVVAGGADSTATANVKRVVLVKRNVGEEAGRRTASPRYQSPARGNGGGISNPQQQPQVQSLSHISSRKEEHSPCRRTRTPLNDIDMNSLPFNPLANNSSSKAPQKTKDVDEEATMAKQQHSVLASQNNKCVDTNTVKVAPHRRTGSNETANINFCIVTDSQPLGTQQFTLDKGERSTPFRYNAVVTPVIISGSESTLRLPQTLTRSRSARRSRDLDIDVEALHATSNYNSLLLQDIQNFHQNNNANAGVNTNTNTNADNSTPFKLPPCLSKACSILEAVADLNSSSSSNLSGPYASDTQKSPSSDPSSAKDSNFGFSANPAGKRRLLQHDDPFVVESEVNGGGDLMAPSIHKYITVRKKDIDADKEQESSGSNSFVGSQLNWTSSSWEPNSADSTDCWTSSRSNTTGKEGSSQLVSTEPPRRNEEGQQKKLSKSSRRESSSHARAGSGKGGLHGAEAST